MIKKICKNCGKEFIVFGKREQTAKYCSMKCYAEQGRILTQLHKDNISKALTNKPKSLTHCKNLSITVKKARRNKNSVYNTIDYIDKQKKGHEKYIIEYHKGEKISRKKGKYIKCKTCGNLIYRQPCFFNREFCSKQCYGKWQTKIGQKQTICKSCGIIFNQNLSSNKKFCSMECHVIKNNPMKRKNIAKKNFETRKKNYPNGTCRRIPTNRGPFRF